jgi:hypothetical protein
LLSPSSSKPSLLYQNNNITSPNFKNHPENNFKINMKVLSSDLSASQQHLIQRKTFDHRKNASTTPTIQKSLSSGKLFNSKRNEMKSASRKENLVGENEPTTASK